MCRRAVIFDALARFSFLFKQTLSQLYGHWFNPLIALVLSWSLVFA